MTDEITQLETLCKEGLQVAESKDIRKMMFFARKAISKLEYLESYAEKEDFKESLRKYSQWVSKDGYGEKYYLLVVGIESIDWDIEVLTWGNADFEKKCPRGSSTFEKFMDEFIPVRGENGA